MNADRLREAARVLRERAEVASPGHWSWERTEKTVTVYEPDEDAAIFEDEMTLPEDAAFIATMHPGVALALADWIDEAGADYFAFGDDEHHAADHEPCDECDSDPRAPHLRRAITVADQILGVEEATR